MKWCTAPDCNNAIKVNHIEAKPVKCRCSHQFCFACGERWHDPVRWVGLEGPSLASKDLEKTSGSGGPSGLIVLAHLL